MFVASAASRESRPASCAVPTDHFPATHTARRSDDHADAPSPSTDGSLPDFAAQFAAAAATAPASTER